MHAGTVMVPKNDSHATAYEKTSRLSPGSCEALVGNSRRGQVVAHKIVQGRPGLIDSKRGCLNPRTVKVHLTDEPLQIFCRQHMEEGFTTHKEGSTICDLPWSVSASVRQGAVVGILNGRETQGHRTRHRCGEAFSWLHD